MGEWLMFAIVFFPFTLGFALFFRRHHLTKTTVSLSFVRKLERAIEITDSQKAVSFCMGNSNSLNHLSHLLNIHLRMTFKVEHYVKIINF
jgi:hypothetical protein